MNINFGTSIRDTIGSIRSMSVLLLSLAGDLEVLATCLVNNNNNDIPRGQDNKPNKLTKQSSRNHYPPVSNILVGIYLAND